MKGVVSVAGPRVLTPLQHHSSGEAATDTSYCFLSLPKQTQPGLPLHCPTTRRLIPGDPPPATTGTERRGTVNGSVWTHTFPPFGTSASLASLPQGLRGVEARPGFSHAILLLWAIIFHVGESHLILELRAQGKEGDPGEGVCGSPPAVRRESEEHSLQGANNAGTQKELPQDLSHFRAPAVPHTAIMPGTKSLNQPLAMVQTAQIAQNDQKYLPRDKFMRKVTICAQNNPKTNLQSLRMHGMMVGEAIQSLQGTFY